MSLGWRERGHATQALAAVSYKARNLTLPLKLNAFPLFLDGHLTLGELVFTKLFESGEVLHHVGARPLDRVFLLFGGSGSCSLGEQTAHAGVGVFQPLDGLKLVVGESMWVGFPLHDPNG
eukprot:scaffold117_cov345-Pavlova_lutheri.AAC.2